MLEDVKVMVEGVARAEAALRALLEEKHAAQRAAEALARETEALAMEVEKELGGDGRDPR